MTSISIIVWSQKKDVRETFRIDRESKGHLTLSEFLRLVLPKGRKDIKSIEVFSVQSEMNKSR